MNPKTGRLHAAFLAPLLAEAEGVGKGAPARESVDAAFERAAQKMIRESERSTVPQGADLPPDWPRFEIGEKVGPIKGWWFRLVDVDLEAQQLLIEPLESATRRTKAPRKKRRRRRR